MIEHDQDPMRHRDDRFLLDSTPRGAVQLGVQIMIFRRNDCLVEQSITFSPASLTPGVMRLPSKRQHCQSRKRATVVSLIVSLTICAIVSPNGFQRKALDGTFYSYTSTYVFSIQTIHSRRDRPWPRQCYRSTTSSTHPVP